ncbi:MAG TPA: lysylphosphatidylglycerol synthase transmembrane domain-containing protein [Candidatus Dormibacteraeota bacterium]|nr:lysylphosphatidylglycerol synthase transmembrane domain-containing protein [Candidatus Dormibacteraeota bacterium]
MTLGAVIAVLFRLRSAKHDLLSAWHRFSWARLPWLLVALSAEAISLVCYALVQRRLLRAGGAHLTRRTMTGLAVAATGVTNLVPGGSVPASGWLVGQYRRRGVSLPLALWAVLAGGYAAAVSVLLLLLVGAAIAGLIGAWAIAGCSVVLAAGSVAVVLAAHRLPALTEWLQRHHAYRGLRLVHRLSAGAAGVLRFRVDVGAGATVMGLSIANWAMDVFVLIGAFGLLGLPIPWGSVLFAYAAAQVAGSVAPLPGGIGFVEGGMIGAFALAGSGVGDAVVATIAYRVVTSWGVAAVGSLALVVMSRRAPSGEEWLDDPDGEALSRIPPVPGQPSVQAGGGSGADGRSGATPGEAESGSGGGTG